MGLLRLVKFVKVHKYSQANVIPNTYDIISIALVLSFISKKVSRTER